jgi:Papain-like cysteine protease AvrRpt2
LVGGGGVVAVVLAASLLYVSAGGVGFGQLATLALTRIGGTAPAVDNQDHLYVLDGWGGLHPVGRAPALRTSASWPNKDIAFSIAIFPDGRGGYVMDGWGKLHPVGDARPVDSPVLRAGWIGARQIVLAQWATPSSPAGYLLDADGDIHPFGGAPAVGGFVTWPGKGIAQGMVLAPDSTRNSVRGYTLDGFGGVHAFGGARPVVANATFADDVARGIVLVPSHGSSVEGYTLDYSGGIHPFGGAPSVSPSFAWPEQDMADSLVAWTAAPAGSPGGWVLDRHGAVHAWGSAPARSASVTWPRLDIARALAGGGAGGTGAGSSERLILDAQVSGNRWGAYFNQRDTRWAGVQVGGTYPMWEIGCLVSSLAMVYSHFGFTSVTPATIASHPEWFTPDGAMLNSGLQIPGHTTTIVINPAADWIRGQLAAGRPVIVGMNLPSGGTHFIAVTGLDGASDYWVNDPWAQEAMHVTFSGDWFTRGPIFEAIAFS